MSTRHVRLSFAAATTLFLCGCALGRTDAVGDSDMPAWQRTTAAEADDTSIRRAAGLEVGIVRQPANDVRIRKLVWEQLDESGLMSPEARQQLNRSGFRVGVAGSTGSWALRSLARDGRTAAGGSSTRNAALEADGPVSVGPRFTLLPGASSRLELQPFVDVSLIPLEKIEALESVRDVSNLKCAIELTVDEIDDEWAMITLLPQFHVGTRAPRLSVDATSEQLPVRQRVIPLYEQQCRIRLHRGEVAVCGLQSPDAWNAGRLFFAPDASAAGKESILLIRLDGIDRLRGESTPGAALASKYQW